MKAVILVALFVTLPSMAFAGAVPKYDVEKFCKMMSDAASGSASVHNACIDMEQKAYNKLKKRWDTIPPKMRKHCDTIARGVGSYQSFLECEKIELKNQKKAKKFNYD